MRISDWSSDVCSSDLSTEQRGSGSGLVPGDARELVVLLGREAPADPLLVLGEDVDAEGPGRLDAGPRAGAPPGEEGHQRRLQRHRGEGAHGHADRTVAVVGGDDGDARGEVRSEEHTSELQSLMRISYAVFCLTKN